MVVGEEEKGVVLMRETSLDVGIRGGLGKKVVERLMRISRRLFGVVVLVRLLGDVVVALSGDGS